MDLVLQEKTFLDITDTVLDANQTKTYDANGYSGGTNYMTAHTIGSSATGGNVVREISSIEIIPPQDANGHYEDLREMWPILDGRSIQHYLNLPGNGNLLMNPLRTLVRGGPTLHLKLGIPVWKAIQRKIPHMPLVATCPKYVDRLALAVHSVYGTTGAGTGGFRIIVKGYEYTPEMLAALAGGWNPNYNINTLRRQVTNKPALAGTFVAKGALGMSTWASFPGGTQQGSIKIDPYWHFAVNNQATDANRSYVFSNETSVGGGSNQVEDPDQDLGILSGSGAALWVRGFGVKAIPLPPGQTGSPGTPGQNLARVGWVLNGTEIPEETGGNAGVFVTPNVNPLAYGAIVGEANRYERVAPLAGELLADGDNLVPFVGANGSAIPKDLVAVATNGVLVEKAS